MASHRRPLPFWKRLRGRKLGLSLAKLSGHAFPEWVSKAFGEHGVGSAIGPGGFRAFGPPGGRLGGVLGRLGGLLADLLD
eukprot:9052300-Pyramimonas_sp.AAC.1